ncbi:MAG: hypothetical protein GXY85_02250 [Candidatus Brocadiaceae bacterium]|nr:hypothetical protein [Candidatus Brocadiaceae bacterium]
MPNDDRSYRGSYGVFDPSHMRTYPLKVRPNKVELDDYVDVAALRRAEFRPPTTPWFRSGLRGGGADQSAGLRELADYIVECHRAGRPVVALSGAHPIKNGQIPIVIDLIERGIVTLFSTNGAGSIHSFELALTGASSESVRDALPNGDFGMAFETGAYLNCTIEIGAELGIGMGEAMGRLYCDADFRRQVIDRTFERYQDTGEYIKPYDGFPYLDSCVFAAAYRAGVPACIHASLGTDIIDQHAGFNPAAKGQSSGHDFLVFAQEMCRFTGGGVILNIGTAIMGPEVVLKAVSMAANVGRAPDGLWTGDFDIRPFVFDDETRDETQAYYYLRDQKSIATRIPKVFGGVGFYFEGLHAETLPALYQCIMRRLGVN